MRGDELLYCASSGIANKNFIVSRTGGQISAPVFPSITVANSNFFLQKQFVTEREYLNYTYSPGSHYHEQIDWRSSLRMASRGVHPPLREVFDRGAAFVRCSGSPSRPRLLRLDFRL